MKYLKLFDSNSNDPFYYKINATEFYKLGVTDNLIPFGNVEIEKLNDLAHDQQIYIGMDPSGRKNYINIICRRQKISGEGEQYFIHKLEDEWYLSRNVANQTYYKCDQFDGLVQFIKDKIINPLKNH